MRAYIIKYNNENCYSFAGRSFTTQLNRADIYECKEQAERVIEYYELKDCKVIEIEIKELK